MPLKLCRDILDTVMKMTNIKSYSELITIPTFEERFEYLKLDGQVGIETFGFNRYLNQAFYKSDEWLSIRDYVITRDNGCDLGVTGYEIYGRILIHHINPITKEDIIHRSKFLLDPDNLITTIKRTHDAIHYGDSNLLIKAPIERRKNDTCPWRH